MPDIKVVTLSELLDILSGEPQERIRVTQEEAFDRFGALSRAVYRIVRKSLHDQRTNRILDVAAQGMTDDDPQIAASSALFMQMFENYIKLNHKDDPVQFKTDIIAALDQAVQSAGKMLGETFDESGTEQSNEDSSFVPHATS